MATLPDRWLLADPTPGDDHPDNRLPLGQRWHARHNAADLNYRRHVIGATNTTTPAERAILGLAAAVELYVAEVPDTADPLSGEYLGDIVGGVRGLLNYDVGRLDAGTLDGWAADTLTRWGLDPDTGAWIGGA